MIGGPRLECTVENAAAVAARIRGEVAGIAVVQVTAIVEDVAERGDEALLEYEEQFSGNERIVVTRDELDEALARLDGAVRAGLETAIANVRAVAEAGVDDEAEVALPQGQTVRLREVPVRRAARYAPRGRHPHPSPGGVGAGAARAARGGGGVGGPARAPPDPAPPPPPG